jgi:hypothetical protein
VSGLKTRNLWRLQALFSAFLSTVKIAPSEVFLPSLVARAMLRFRNARGPVDGQTKWLFAISCGVTCVASAVPKEKMASHGGHGGVTDRRWNVLAQEVKPAVRSASCSLDSRLLECPGPQNFRTTHTKQRRHYCQPKKHSLRDKAVFFVAVSKHGSRMRDKGKAGVPWLTKVQVPLTNKD